MGSAYVERLRLQQPRLPRLRRRPTRQFRANPPDLSSFYVRAATGRWCRSTSVVRGARDDRAAGHQPLQPVPLGRDHRLRRRPGVSSGQAIADDAGRWRPGAAARVRLRVVGAVARRDQGRARRPALIFGLGLLLVYLMLAAQYESWCCRSSSCWRAARGARRPVGAVGARPQQRRLLPDRPGDAHRPGGEERDPRSSSSPSSCANAACRIVGGRGRGGAHPPAADPDDVAGVHPGRDAAGASPPAPGAAARNSVGTAVAGGMVVSHVPQPALHSRALRGGPDGHRQPTARSSPRGAGRCVA